MTPSDRSSKILLAGAIVSAAMHAGLATGFVRWSHAQAPRDSTPAPRPNSPKAPEPVPPPRHKPIKLGIAKSDATTVAWLGFEKPTEHQAEKGLIDQSAMTIAAPGPPAAAATPAPAEPSEPTPEPPAPAQPAAPPQTPAPAEPAPDFRELTESIAKTGERLIAMAQNVAAALEAAIPPAPPPPAPRQPPTTEPRVAAAPRPQNPKPPVPPTPAAGQSGMPGLPADKESVASAVKKSPTVRPGQVLAAQGLEIQTRHPRWATTTMLTRRPRNPTLIITFGPDGRVKSADFARDGGRTYNTGYSDVDEPLLNAVYAWTASGKAIQEAAARAASGDPGEADKGEVTIMLTVQLVG